MKRIICGTVLAGVVALSAQGNKASGQPRFAVVSIHPVPPNAPMAYFPEGFTPVRPGGQYIYSRASLPGMIAFAYSIGNPGIQLLGVPEWAKDQSYDVTAKPDDGFPLLSSAENVAMVRLMMRGLLEERFGLKVHSENRPGRVLSLEVAKGGIKMREVTDPNSVGGGVDMALDDVSGRLISKGCTVSMLANGLSHWLKTPVLDRTGLMGSYAFDIRWNDPVTTPDGQRASGFGIGAAGLGQLISNVKSQLGLQLQKVNGSVEYWIVDQVTQSTPN